MNLTEAQKTMIKAKLNNFLDDAGDIPTQEFMNSLYEGFVNLSYESIRLQKINRAMTSLAIIGALVALIFTNWKIVVVILFGYISANLFVGWQHSRMITKKTLWSFEKQRAAMALITEPAWQHELKRGGIQSR